MMFNITKKINGVMTKITDKTDAFIASLSWLPTIHKEKSHRSLG